MKCGNCKKNDVYISPKGRQSVFCASCLVDAFVELGVLDKQFCDCGAKFGDDGWCPNCRVYRREGNLTMRAPDLAESDAPDDPNWPDRDLLGTFDEPA